MNETADFCNTVRHLVRLHMQHIKSTKCDNQTQSIEKYRQQFKTLRVSSARGIGHTATGLSLLRDLPDSIMIVHSNKSAASLCKKAPDVADRIFPLQFLDEEDWKRSCLVAETVPVVVVDTTSLQNSRASNREKLEEVIFRLNRLVNVKLFLFLE